MMRLAVLGCLLTCVTVLVPSLRAQDSPLDEVQKRRKVEADRLEQEIRTALAEADRLKATDPTKALQILEAALEKLAADTALSIAQTANLRLSLKDRIEAIKSGRAKAEAAEAASRAAWHSARLALERTAGTTLETYGISLDEARRGEVARQSAAPPASENK
jgi:septal ring factor EnvC (AmiA/AmiB activator)